MASYLPQADSSFNSWFQNFKTLINAAPTDYGLVAGDATAINGQWTSWNAAYQVTLVPATRTSPAIAAKDVARANAESIIRPYAMQIRNNSAVSDSLKVGLGLTIVPTSGTPVPPPTTFPNASLRLATPLVSTLTYQDSDATSGKAKPYGCVGVELVATVGTSPAVDPDVALPKAIVTKSPCRLRWEPSQVGKVATIWGRYLTRSGPGGEVQRGPWSAPTSFTII